MSDCPSMPVLSGNSLSANLVQEQVARVQSYATEAFSAARQALESLAGFQIDSVTPHIDFDDVNADFQPFNKPAIPADPNLQFSAVSAPTLPSVASVPGLNIGTAPTFNESAPVLVFPGAPTGLNATPPGDPPATTAVTIPDAPVSVIPDAPSLADLTLPEVLQVSLTQVEADFSTAKGHQPIAPSLQIIENHVANVLSVRSMVDSALAQHTAAPDKLTTMLAGGTGIPAAIEQQLRERAYAAEDTQAFQVQNQVMEQWNARGFTLASGLLYDQLDGVRQASQDRKQALNRDIFAQAAQWEIENLRFAVQQGIVYEGQLTQYMLQAYELSDTIAWKVFQAGDAVFKNKLDQYRVAVQVWNEERQAVQEELKIELSKIEAYKAELEAQQLIGTINEQSIKIYATRIEAVKALYDQYKNQILAINAIIDVDKAKLEGYKSKVDAYTAMVQANKTEWEGYGEAVRGELGKVQIYQALAGAFAERIRGYSAGIDAQKTAVDAQVAINKEQTDRFVAQLDSYKAQVQAELGRVQAGASIYDGKSRMYAAELSAESARADSDTKGFQLQLEAAKTTGMFQIEEQKMVVEQIKSAALIQAQVLEAIARTSAQLAAASMSAVNMSASLSSSGSESHSFSQSSSCSTTYSHSSS